MQEFIDNGFVQHNDYLIYSKPNANGVYIKATPKPEHVEIVAYSFHDDSWYGEAYIRKEVLSTQLVKGWVEHLLLINDNVQQDESDFLNELLMFPITLSIN